MSENLVKFIEAVRQDESLQEKLMAEGADPVAIAADMGYAITHAELMQAHAQQAQDLSDEELGRASGGSTLATIYLGPGPGLQEGLELLW